MALLEPQFCAQAWWFSHMPGSKCAFRRDETLIFASAPRPCRVAAPLASAGRFLPCSKTLKTLGPFVKKFSGLRLARQDAQHAFSIVFYEEKWHQTSQTLVFVGGCGQFLQGGQEPYKRVPCGHDSKKPISQSLNQPIAPSIKHPLNQSTHQSMIPGPAECA